MKGGDYMEPTILLVFLPLFVFWAIGAAILYFGPDDEAEEREDD